MNDIAIRDKDNNVIKPQNVYTDDSKFNQLTYSSLSPTKAIKGYVVFDVKKNSKYELELKLTDVEENNDVARTEIDTSNYKDYGEVVKKVTDSYIKQVFLSIKLDQKDKNLKNDVSIAKDEFKKQFMDVLNNSLDSFEFYEPSVEELNKIMNSFIKNNSERSKVEYFVKELTPNTSKILVKPELLSFNGIDEKKIMDSFVSNNLNTTDDYEKLQKEAEKHMIQSIPDNLNQASIEPPEYMPKDGYEIVLNKKENKWEIDTSKSSDNYDFELLEAAFMSAK